MGFKQPLFSCLFLSLFIVLSVGITNSFSADSKNPDSVEAIMAEMSDEQVRQMLIQELQNNLDQEKADTLSASSGGPGSPLAILLNSLEDESAESGDQFAKLWEGLPNLFPDLYKVLVTL